MWFRKYSILSLKILLLYVCTTSANDCAPRDYGHGSVVCVCNSTFCDTLPTIGELQKDDYVFFTSNKEGLRFEQESGTFDTPELAVNAYDVYVNASETFQTIVGFGGAFTDSTGINLLSLPSEAQKKLMEAYFSADGSEYSLCRVPIGGTDFSSRGYSYADDGNGTIDSFALQDEDFKYKIPIIQEAYNMMNGTLALFSSLWSSPTWMKENDKFSGGYLKKEYYQMLADYYVKFFESYAANGIKFWGTTIQNEPATGVLGLDINSIAWFPDQLIAWLSNNLGPTIRNSEFSDIKLIIHDDSRTLLPLVQDYFDNEEALKYIDGVGVHWYEDFFTPTDFLDYAKTDKKDIFLLATEACAGYLPIDTHVILGEWDRADAYSTNIIDVLNKDGVGWIDWNMALNTEGGPTYISNFVDSTILVNATAGEFYKQPMYYALAHFSKFIPPGSKRVQSSQSTWATLSGIKSTAFLRPDNYTTVIIENTGDDSHQVLISKDANKRITLRISGNSINTLVYND